MMKRVPNVQDEFHPTLIIKSYTDEQKRNYASPTI
jgi:hypothetical protein